MIFVPDNHKFCHQSSSVRSLFRVIVSMTTMMRRAPPFFNILIEFTSGPILRSCALKSVFLSSVPDNSAHVLLHASTPAFLLAAGVCGGTTKVSSKSSVVGFHWHMKASVSAPKSVTCPVCEVSVTPGFAAVCSHHAR